MKDYTRVIENSDNRKKEREDFIVNYQIYDNKEIIINYADGTKSHIQYSKEKEEEILTRMKEQVKKYGALMQEFCFNNKKDLSEINIENRVAIFFVTVIIASGMISSVGVPLLLLGTSFVFCALFGDIPKIIKNKRMLDDFDKCLMFIRNEQKINKNVLDRENICIQEINDILEEVIVDMPNGKKGITLNSIEKINLDKLNKIVKHVNLAETFKVMKEAYDRKKAIVIEKGKEIERQIKEEKRSPIDSLLTIEDVARLREIDEIHNQCLFSDKNETSFCDRYSGYDITDVKKRVRKR